jgi:hypothetical protein
VKLFQRQSSILTSNTGQLETAEGATGAGWDAKTKSLNSGYYLIQSKIMPMNFLDAYEGDDEGPIGPEGNH